jgi:hypothetical protein
MSDLQLARTAAALVLDLHEKTLRAAEGGPAQAEEWVKLRADFVSVCSTSAAVLAAAFQDLDAAGAEEAADTFEQMLEERLKQPRHMHNPHNEGWIDALEHVVGMLRLRALIPLPAPDGGSAAGAAPFDHSHAARGRIVAHKAHADLPGTWRTQKMRYNSFALQVELPCINGLSAWFTVATFHEAGDDERMITDGARQEAGEYAAKFAAFTKQIADVAAEEQGGAVIGVANTPLPAPDAGWRTIDSAPKDDPNFQALACHQASDDSWAYYIINRHDIGGRYECWVVPPGRPISPTHWLPLLAPPVGGSAPAEDSGPV